MRKTITLAAAAAALALAAPASAGAVKYAGKTSGGAKITFNFAKGKMKKMRSFIYVTCTSAQSSEVKGGVDYYRPPGAIPVGKEVKRSERQPSAVAYGNPTKYYTVKSKRKGKRITGKLRLSFSYYIPDLYYPRIYMCTGVTNFSAKRA